MNRIVRVHLSATAMQTTSRHRFAGFRPDWSPRTRPPVFPSPDQSPALAVPLNAELQVKCREASECDREQDITGGAPSTNCRARSRFPIASSSVTIANNNRHIKPKLPKREALPPQLRRADIAHKPSGTGPPPRQQSRANQSGHPWACHDSSSVSDRHARWY